MTTRKHIRLSALSFVLVLCGSLLVSCMSPVFSTIVSADAASRFGDENNKHYSAIALRDCLAQLGSRKTSISSDVMFGSGTPGAPGPHVAIGRWLEPDDGDFDCSDESTTSRAAGFLGFASVGDYLKGIGYSVRVVHIPKQCSGYNPQVCRDPHDATTYTINGNDKAGQLVGKYGQSDIAVYFMHLVVFQRGCQINVPPQAGDKTVTMKQITNQGGSFVTKDVPAGFSFKQQGVNNNPTSGGGGGTGNGTITQVDTQNQLIVKFDYNDVSKTCGHILDTMNSMAGAVAAWDNQHKDEAITTDVINKGTAGITDKAGSLPSCQGGSLGWLICPLTEMFSSIISAIAKYIDGLLFFKPLIIGDTASGDAIYSLWRVVIVPANLLLVVAFLVVIFSQATSFGLSSYGIKKMLPRIIAAAILINLSYFLCAVAVDITNVIGAGVKGMMEGVPLPNGTSLRGSTWVDWLATGVVGSLVTGTTVVTGAVFYIVPMLAAAVIAVLTAFLVVAARQVLITLMIIIAPLAFAALVLPNTNELFTKWRKAFAALLFMYPLIMLVFYGSMVVSKIVALTTPQANDPAVNLIQQILVLCILIFPLFSLPIIMKAAGGLLQRFGLWANDKSKGLIDRSNMWAKKKKARTTYQQMKELSNNAKDLSAQRTAISRFSNSKGAWGFIARRGAYGLGRKNSILPSTNRANVLLGSQAMKAKSGIDKDEREMIGAHINRRAAELLSEGRVSSDGKTFTNSHGQTQGIDTLDQKTQDALKYARDNNVLSTTNGSKAISEVLYAQGGMNSARLEGLTSGVTKEDRADFIDHSNQHAAQAGMKHMMFNSVDNAGNIHVGGTLGEGKQTHEGVANKLVEGGLSNISKESFDDADPRKDAALAAALHTFRRDNAEAFEKELAKMRPEQVKKMGDMFARQLAAGNGSVMENAQMTGVSLDVTYNAAIAKYKP